MDENRKFAKGGSDIMSILPYVVGGIVAVSVISIFAALGMALTREGENVPESSGTSACASWGSGPKQITDAISLAARKVGISELIVATIFQTENGDDWTKANLIVSEGKWENGPWQPSASGAQGPFQFMPKTWSSVGISVENNNTCCQNDGDTCSKKPECHSPKVENIYDASFAAAAYLKGIADHNSIKTNTTVENEIKCLAAGYQGGGSVCEGWKKNGYSDPVPSGNNGYAKRAWQNFTTLSKSCDTLNIIPGEPSLDKPDPSWDQSYRKKAPVKDWPKAVKAGDGNGARVLGQMHVSGVVLHWTAGGSVDGAISAMTSSGSFVQLIIGPKGDVHQLLPLNSRVASGSGDGNSFAVGIEIVGTGEKDLLNNKEQYDKVVDTVDYLISTYQIPRVRGNTMNLASQKGIFGHFQTQQKAGSNGKPTWDGGMKGCKSSAGKTDPGVTYLKNVWDALEATGSGCVGINSKGGPLCYPNKDCNAK